MFNQKGFSCLVTKLSSMILNVGCGNWPSGDVNCDLFKGASGERTGDSIHVGRMINPKWTDNFVMQCGIFAVSFKHIQFGFQLSCD